MGRTLRARIANTVRYEAATPSAGRSRDGLTRVPAAQLALALLLVSLPFAGSVLPGCSESPTSAGTDDDPLEYVTPEDVGYSSEGLEDVKAAAEASGYAAVMALYDGKVFFSWGDNTRNFRCHSIRKPFLSALYGIHVDGGDLDPDRTLEDLGIDDIPPSLTPEEKQATVRDLLKSRSGVYHEAAAETQEMADARPERGSHAPGTFFYYNNWDFNALGTIFEQETGAAIFEEFKRQIADPIGMEDFSVDSCYYKYEPEKSAHPAYHFRMSARDMARFGALYQKGGMWKGREIVPADWIAESTAAYSVCDEPTGIGYGYMWYVFPEGSAVADMVGAPGFYHTGIGVHALVIVPDLNLVIVERYDTDGEWEDPGEVGMDIAFMILDCRIYE
jgi:CubicO group peptidase (beta-lactamase class C family)